MGDGPMNRLVGSGFREPIATAWARLTPALRRGVSRIGTRLRAIRWRRLLTFAALAAAFGLVVAGVALIYAPAGLIAGGLGLFALLTFRPENAGRLTWPK